jgi:hypothetical protein
MSIQSDVFLCGWRVQSEIRLHELTPWEKPDADVDIFIRLGRVPPLEKIAVSKKRLTIDEAGICRLEIPGIVTFSVRDGCEVVVDPLASPDSLEMRSYLFGTGLGLLCHQRGVFPLHGSCLRLGQGAVIFTGNSGAGKSTLAAALTHRGHTLMADDVCALTETDRGWVVWPAFPRVKLVSDSLKAVLGVEPEKDGLSLRGKHHFRFEPVHAFTVEPVPLEAIYFLERAEDAEPDSISEIPGLKRLALLQSQIFRPKAGNLLGCGPFLFRSVTSIAATVPIRQLHRSFDLERIGATVAMLEEAHRLPAPPFFQGD